MSAGHTPEGDRSFTSSVVRNLAGALALVALVTAAFWGVGRFQADSAGPGPIITGSPSEPSEPPASTPPSTEGSDSPSPSESVEPSETQTPAPPAIDPASISVQVLDAAGDGGEKATDVAAKLRAAGYRVVAETDAVRVYEESTAFFTRGHQPAARQIAEFLPAFDVVDEKPANLTDSVNVHIVVGEDYPAP